MYSQLRIFFNNRLVKTPPGAADRDFVQYMTHGQDETGGFYVLYKNTVHPGIPLKSGVIR